MQEETPNLEPQENPTPETQEPVKPAAPEENSTDQPAEEPASVEMSEMATMPEPKKGHGPLWFLLVLIILGALGYFVGWPYLQNINEMPKDENVAMEEHMQEDAMMEKEDGEAMEKEGEAMEKPMTIEEACVKSGGTYANEGCTCPADLEADGSPTYSLEEETGQCIDAFGLPGGELGVMVKEKHGEAMEGGPGIPEQPAEPPYEASWQEAEVVAANGYSPDLAIDKDGNAHICYSYGLKVDDEANLRLDYATNVSGEWVSSTIDSTLGNGWYCSIEFDSKGEIYVSYYDHRNGDLKLATNASGEWATETLDSVGSLGVLTNLFIDSEDNLHISYMNKALGAVKYATNKSGEWTYELVENTIGFDWAESVSSVAVDSAGNVHMSYYDQLRTKLKYATNATGSWVNTTVDDEGDVGSWSDLLLDSDGNVHISYHDADKGNLKYATNATGEWVTSIKYGTEGDDVGEYSNIEQASDGKLLFAYLNDNKHTTDLDQQEVIVELGDDAEVELVLHMGKAEEYHLIADDNDPMEIRYRAYK